MAGELSKLNLEVARRAVGLQSAAMLQILDSFVEDPAAAVDMGQQIMRAADSGQLDQQIAQTVFPTVQRIMQATQQAQGQAPQR